MTNYPHARRRGMTPRHAFLPVLFLILAGFLGGCGSSTTLASSPLPRPTSRPIWQLKGVIHEFSSNVHGPLTITAGPDQSLWFTEMLSNGTTSPLAGKIGRITIAGQIKEFALPINSIPGGITTGPDGNLWFTEPGKIGRITLAGQVKEFPLPSRSIGSTRGSITSGPDGGLWFTEVGNNKIGHLT